jgi:ATP-binding cassette subfamily B protein
MTAVLDECAWTANGLALALPWLMGRYDNPAGAARAARVDGAGDFEQVLAAATDAANLRMTAITCAYGRTQACLKTLAPIVLNLPGAAQALFVVEASRRHVVVVTPTGRRERLRADDVERRLLDGVGGPDVDGAVAALESELGAKGRRIGRALMRQLGFERPLFIGWALEPIRSSATPRELSVRTCVPLLATHLLQFSLWIASWVALVAVLSGAGERHNLIVIWVAALVTALALLPVETALEQALASRIGVAVRRRLLDGALNADKKFVGALGLGRMIAQSLETHHVDAMAARGSIKVALATIDVAIVCLVYGVARGVDALLVLFLAVIAWGAYWASDYYKRAVRQLAENQHATAIHVEQLVGHRTRKAFVHAQQWNDEEDRAIARYHEASRRFDAAYLRIAGLPRMWTVLALFVVLVTLFRNYGDAASVENVAMVGFVVATFAALQSIVFGASEAIRAWVSFKSLASVAADPGAHEDRAGQRQSAAGEFACRGVSYSYPRSLRPVLEDVNLWIGDGERVLLTGRSGSGKSTLAAVLAGRIAQDSGVVLSGGLDRHIAGMKQWRGLVCYVPQIGNNHVLTETFAFNLLLGRAWPPTPEDLDDARTVACDLGLDSLLQRMPAGMMQMVGEGGWALSQGEKVRVCIARGILQRPALLIADEVLSPLDADTAAKTLDALERHADRLMLIAHS